VRNRSGGVDKEIPMTLIVPSLFGLVRIFPSANNRQIDGWLRVGVASLIGDDSAIHFSSILPMASDILCPRNVNMHATYILLSPVAAQYIRAFLAWNHEISSSVSRVSTLRFSCRVHRFGFGSSIEVPPWLAYGK
jgi:hypothetical protein